jgi:hypothetical protein
VRDSVTTFLQIDLQSLFGTSNRNKKLDFEKIHEYFSSRETEYLTGSCVYSVKSPDFDSSRFEAKIRVIGYDLKVKNLPRSSPRTFKSLTQPVSHVVSIAIDCVSRMDRFDKLILLSNNTSGFYDLCKFLRDNGKKVELWSFQENYDSVLEPIVDRHFIDDDFCLQKTNISVFGANDGPDSFNFDTDSTSTVEAYR